MKYDVTYRSELFDAGKDWEGTQITGYTHAVMLELENGQRFILKTSEYPDVEVINGEVIDNTAQVLEITNNRVAKIENHLASGGKLNYKHWEEIYPLYGSDTSTHLTPFKISLFINAPRSFEDYY